MLEPADRRIIALAIPALGSLAVEPLYVLVDTAIVGRLGTAQLGGLALSATVLALVVTACNFLTYGTTERVARRLGAGDRTGAADVGVQAMWLSAHRRPSPLALLVAAGAELLGHALGGVGRRARLRRDLPAHRRRRAAVRRLRAGRPGHAARRCPTTARR